MRVPTPEMGCRWRSPFAFTTAETTSVSCAPDPRRRDGFPRRRSPSYVEEGMRVPTPEMGCRWRSPLLLDQFAHVNQMLISFVNPEGNARLGFVPTAVAIPVV